MFNNLISILWLNWYLRIKASGFETGYYEDIYTSKYYKDIFDFRELKSS